MTDPRWVALSLCPQIGSTKLTSLLTHFDHNLDRILGASTESLLQVSGIGPRIAQEIQTIDLAKTEGDIARWQQAGVFIITKNDSDYPEPLRKIDDPPPTLFIRGKYDPQHFENALAIVGTRSPAEQSTTHAYDLGYEYARQGITVISGLALGIDTYAHRGALSYASGITIAIIGSGVLHVYPKQNDGLAQEIMQRGSVISEISPDARPARPWLVARNRIISGVSRQLVVVETTIDGGAMYAAKRAQAQGRTVYAIDSPASGNQFLLANGAKVINPLNAH